MTTNGHDMDATRSGRIVIVGAGLAGLFTALKLAPMPVTVVSAAPLGEGASSVWAQGGIAAAVSEGDTPAAHAADTIRAGAGIVDTDMAHLLAGEAPARIADLLAYGVPFDKDLDGRLQLSREAAHGARRIVRVNGDRAGQAIMAALIATVRATPSIEVLEGFAAKDLMVAGGAVTGVVLARSGAHDAEPVQRLAARAVVLASGGAGQLFAVTTNPKAARAEGLAMAARAGAVIADAEFVQFHPTAINVGRDPAPLATEALRGEGAALVNGQGARFMARIHPDGDLGPRDIVARAVHREVAGGRGAFLDARAIANFATRFPTVFASCRAAGIEPANDLIPIAPAAHYHMGGILTDAHGRSTVSGLWACGEVASTGAHGANRLASNSLLEAVVFGARIAEDLAGRFAGAHIGGDPAALDARQDASHDVASLHGERIRRVMRATMSAHAGVERDREGLVHVLKDIARLERAAHGGLTLLNMLTAAKVIAAAALVRTESRGSHFRRDYPDADPALDHRSLLTLDAVDAIAADARDTSVPAAHETSIAHS